MALSALPPRARSRYGFLLSDLANGATMSRAHGSLAHSKPYYKTPGSRETEIFANVIGISDKSAIAAQMLERLFPALYREVMDLLETIQ